MIIMPWGRVGSNLIMSIIAQISTAKLENETLIHIKGETAQLLWYREFYELGSDRLSRPIIGSKQNVLSIANPALMGQMFLRDGIKVIRMRRDNLVKAAVSQIRAQQYAAKTKMETGRASWAVKKGEKGLGPSLIDPIVLRERLRIMKDSHDQMMDMLPKAMVFEIEYSEIHDDLHGVVRRLRAWLPLPGSRAFKVPHQKATPDDLRHAILNYEEVRNSLFGTPYAEQIGT